MSTHRTPLPRVRYSPVNGTSASVRPAAAARCWLCTPPLGGQNVLANGSQVPPHLALSGIAPERGFKGSLHLGTISVYVVTLGFTLCLVLAVKAGQDRVTCPASLAELRVSRRCSLIKSCLMTYSRIEETS